MPTPGATRSTIGPRFEKLASASLRSVAPTTITLSSRVAVRVSASLPAAHTSSAPLERT